MGRGLPIVIDAPSNPMNNQTNARKFTEITRNLLLSSVRQMLADDKARTKAFWNARKARKG